MKESLKEKFNSVKTNLKLAWEKTIHKDDIKERNRATAKDNLKRNIKV